MRIRGRGEPPEDLFVEGELSPRARQTARPRPLQGEPAFHHAESAEPNGTMEREVVLDRLTELTEEVKALQSAVGSKEADAPADGAGEDPEDDAAAPAPRQPAPARVPAPRVSSNGERATPLSRAVSDILASAEAAAAEIRAAAEAEAAQLRADAEAEADAIRADLMAKARVEAEAEAERIMEELAADVKALAATLGGATKRALDQAEGSVSE